MIFDTIETSEKGNSCLLPDFLYAELHLTNYKICRNDRLDGAGGGVAIAIRGRIKHKLLPSYNTRVIETYGIEIETNMGKVNFPKDLK